MSIQAADLAPNFLHRSNIVAADLPRISEPCVILEHSGRDSDGAEFHCFTVGGWLDGKPLGDMRGGCTVGGDVIIISGMGADEAKFVASMGLHDTIEAMQRDGERYIEAQAALARLASVSPETRIDKATAPACDKSDAFEADAAAIRKLRCDDILLTVGGSEP